MPEQDGVLGFRGQPKNSAYVIGIPQECFHATAEHEISSGYPDSNTVYFHALLCIFFLLHFPVSFLRAIFVSGITRAFPLFIAHSAHFRILRILCIFVHFVHFAHSAHFVHFRPPPPRW